MDKRKQIEAMARLDGYLVTYERDGVLWGENDDYMDILDDYLSDLNAVQRVIDGLSDEEIGDYHVALWATTSPTGTLKDFHTAKCPQKVEAILKAKGLWV